MALHGRLPQKREAFEGIALGAWVTKQRFAYRQGVLKPERAAALQVVPGWSWHPQEEANAENLSAKLSCLQVRAGQTRPLR